MITNFEQITKELTKEEKLMLPFVILEFEKHTVKNPIKEPDFLKNFNMITREKPIFKKLTGVRLRKMVNYIRTNGILPLIATSKGYYISFDRNEIKKQIKSLQERANSINRCADGLQSFSREYSVVDLISRCR
jgi:hypothetical protein